MFGMVLKILNHRANYFKYNIHRTASNKNDEMPLHLLTGFSSSD